MNSQLNKSLFGQISSIENQDYEARIVLEKVSRVRSGSVVDG